MINYLLRLIKIFTVPTVANAKIYLSKANDYNGDVTVVQFILILVCLLSSKLADLILNC